MVKCANCGTGWTSAGLPLCPVCGTKVPDVAAPAPLAAAAAPEAVVHKNGSAVIDVPPDIRQEAVEPEHPPYLLPQLKRVEPAPAPVARKTEIHREAAEPEHPPDVFPQLKRVEPVREPVVRKTEIHREAAEPEPPPYLFPQLKRVEPAPIAPTPAPLPVVKKEDPVDVAARLQLLDASAVNVPAPRELRELPAPARPLHGPLILGALAFIPILALPLTLAFESTRVLGVLGFCMSGFFAPFAPIAWMAGLSAEKRRREQGLRAERSVSIGRLLGQAATLILIAEMTVGLVAIAALRLSGKFPNTFWSYF
jgi:hypothetical protein